MTGLQENIFMNIKKFFYIFIAFFAGVLASCTDNDSVFSNTERSGFTICVPAISNFTSRANGSSTRAETEELKYSSLILFAFYKESGVEKAEFFSLTPKTGNLSVVNNYIEYPINLPKDRTYRFFLVANYFDADAPENNPSSLPSTEDALKEKFQSVTADFNCQIPEAGLAMSADHSDFYEISDSGNTSLGNGFTYDGGEVEIYADLTFLFAKVTVVPKDASEEPAVISEIKFHNISDAEPLFPETGFNYGKIAEVTPDPATTEPLQGWNITPSVSFYIPERYMTSAADQSFLTFTIGGKEVILALGEADNSGSGAETPLTVPELTTDRSVKRGTHYKYTLVTYDKITLEVERWTPQTVLATLAGPVFLHVEQQEYEVKAGIETNVWYDSNVSISVDSPEYPENGGTPLYLWEADPENNNLKIWVNPDIPSSEFDAIRNSITAGEGKYDFFHIIAGPIYKKIKVTPLVLEYYLNVSPTTIPIDVSLRVSSGDYQGNIPVTINTNYPKIKVELGGDWSSLPSDEFEDSSADPIRVGEVKKVGTEEQFTQVTITTSPVTVVSKGRVNYQVKFLGLNSGLKTWTDDYSVTFNVIGLDEEGMAQEVIPVTVNVMPAILNYKIHFKPEKGNWKDPHIYIYECLEFPADYTESYKGKTLANKPIGYRDNNDATKPNAALEYSYTGAVSFKGWDYQKNYDLLFKENGDLKSFSGWDQNGFYMFNGLDYTEWSAKIATSQRYNYNVDFCSEHRKEVVENGWCTLCAWESSTMNRLWPGIRMKPERNGWFEFELTGIATPGKTLIMFADQHTSEGAGNLGDRRFPADLQVGIPLFDYSTKEGWLLYNGDVTDRKKNQFTSENLNPVSNRYRIYWKKETYNNQELNNIHITIDGVAITNKNSWNKSGDTGNYWYYNFTTNADPTTAKIKITVFGYGLTGTEYGPFDLSDFYLVNSLGRNCAYLNNTSLAHGIPASN